MRDYTSKKIKRQQTPSEAYPELTKFLAQLYIASEPSASLISFAKFGKILGVKRQAFAQYVAKEKARQLEEQLKVINQKAIAMFKEKIKGMNAQEALEALVKEYES